MVKEKESVLATIASARFHGEVLGKIVGSRYYVYQTARVDDLANELACWDEILSIGVVDEDMAVVGIIERRELLSILSQQFGRDVYGNKTVARVVKTVPCFDVQRNIFSVAEELNIVLHARQTSYFLLTKDGGSFAGVISSRDLLIYLSDITRKDIALARTLQERIVRNNLVQGSDHIRSVFMTRMAKGVGGDFYFGKWIDDKVWAGAICDVSGKGISASLISAMLGGMISVHDFSSGLEILIKKINLYLVENFEGEKYVTAVFWQYDEKSSRLTLYDMGHSFCYLKREGRFFRLKSKASNYPLGLSAETTYYCDHYQLLSEDCLLFLTDGVFEQINEAGESFGMSRVSACLNGVRQYGLLEVGKYLMDSLYHFRGAQPQHDDMSIVMLQIKGA